MSQSATRLVVLVALGVAAVVTGLIATNRVPSVGDGESGNTTLIDQAFSGPNTRSGKLAVDLRMSVEGRAAAQLGGTGSVKLTGAFNDSRKGGKPSVALDGRADFAGESFGFGMTVVNKRAFFGFNGAHYELPRAQAQQLFGQLTQAETTTGAIGVLGFDPRDWFTDVRDEGTATVDGVATRHVSAGVDTDRMIDDVLALAAKAPTGSPPPQITGEDRGQIKDSLKDVRTDIYTGRSDNVIRRMTMRAEIEAEDGSGRFDLDLRLSDVNKPQKIVPPANVKPFSQFQSDLNSGLLRGLTGVTGGAGSPPASAPSAPAPSNPAAAAVPGAAQPYLACVRGAGTQAELQRCAQLLE